MEVKTGRFEIRVIKEEDNDQWYNFFADGVALSELLSIDRFDMGFSRFDLDYFAVDKAQFPDYDLMGIIDRAVQGFLGEAPSFTQFSSQRAILYGCHCGSDYCGVISCEVILTDDSVLWQNIGYEDDNGLLKHKNHKPKTTEEIKEDYPPSTYIARLTFERSAYFDVFPVTKKTLRY